MSGLRRHCFLFRKLSGQKDRNSSSTILPSTPAESNLVYLRFGRYGDGTLFVTQYILPQDQNGSDWSTYIYWILLTLELTCDIVQFRMLSDIFWKVFGDNPLIDHDGDAEAEVPKVQGNSFWNGPFFLPETHQVDALLVEAGIKFLSFWGWWFFQAFGY